MVDVCTDRESMFILPRRKGESEQERQAADRLTQLGRSLREPGIGSIPANSRQAKGRVERSFLTAQARLGPVAQRLEQRTHNLTLPFNSRDRGFRAGPHGTSLQSVRQLRRPPISP